MIIITYYHHYEPLIIDFDCYSLKFAYLPSICLMMLHILLVSGPSSAHRQGLGGANEDMLGTGEPWEVYVLNKEVG